MAFVAERGELWLEEGADGLGVKVGREDVEVGRRRVEVRESGG